MCSVYGLSGASGEFSLSLHQIPHSMVNGFPGRHNCLWCLIPSSSLKVPLAVRGRFAERSLDSLKSDHGRFLAEGGGDIRKAKLFKNVIEDYFFDIPLENVIT